MVYGKVSGRLPLEKQILIYEWQSLLKSAIEKPETRQPKGIRSLPLQEKQDVAIFWYDPEGNYCRESETLHPLQYFSHSRFGAGYFMQGLEARMR